MPVPLLHRQLHQHLSQYIHPQDQRHLSGFSENVAALLQSGSGCLSHWIPFLQHRDCAARSQMERLNYFVNNPKITAETFYHRLIRQFLSGWEGMEVLLTLDTSLFWEDYCLVEVCVAWGGRSFPIAQRVLEHSSATVAYGDYHAVLETAQALLPPNCRVVLLADRGFEHGELIRWLRRQQWPWAIRAKCDLNITRPDGITWKVSELIPPKDEAYIFHAVTILGDIQCELATANLSVAGEAWAVLTDTPASIQTFHLYGQRFGGIEPHFKDYQSAGFRLPQSRLRGAHALSTLLMLLAAATLIALSVAILLMSQGRRQSIDWHSQRGLSFFQLGLREIQRLCYLRLPLPQLTQLPNSNPKSAHASIKKRRQLEQRIEFSKVTAFAC